MLNLTIKIGNALLTDTINCFDQLNESSKVRLKNSGFFNKVYKKERFDFKNKVKNFNLLLYPFLQFVL